MKKWLFYILLFANGYANAQDTLTINNTISAANNNVVEKIAFSKRQWLVGGGSALVYGSSFILLNQAWYKDYPRSSLHSFDDSGEWLQMDKIGHGWTAYHSSRVNTRLWQWAGVSQNNAVWLGTGTSLAYMLAIEYLDGRSAEWGWSWPDAAADLFGAALFATQELAWREQKISLKFSSSPHSYQPADVQQRADALFGSSLPEKLLKDYNTQTYWLSFNLKSLFKSIELPNYLNIAFGYSGEGMLGGYENIGRDKEGNIVFDGSDILRYRQWLLSADIDLTKIKTKSRFLRSLFSVVNVLKIPAPALELSNGRIRGHWLYF